MRTCHWPGYPLAEAELVAVIRGPGSFTGLRVGVATAKAVAWAGGATLLGLSGFEVVAVESARLTGWTDEPLAIAYDAGRGEVFATWATPAGDDGWRMPASFSHRLPPGFRRPPQPV